MHGLNNTMTQLSFILEKMPPESTRKFVLTGCSAGGVATLTWADYFREKILQRNPSVQYIAYPDSSFFVDYANVKTG
jgi:exopolysaccharide biosynthesis predicted pyruvyltransferase EpsI